MFNLVFVMVTLCPLIGLILMENGAYGLDVGSFGYPNGVSIAYAIHLLTMYSAFFWVCRRDRARRRRPRKLRPGTRGDVGPADERRVPYSRESFQVLSFWILGINVCLLAFVFFVVGADEVVRGEVGKGDFRSQLGGYGIFAYMARDFVTPMLGALAAFVYMRCEPRRRELALLCFNLSVIGLSGAIWGYSAATLFLLIPAFVLLVSRLTVSKTVILIVGALASAVFFTSFYQGHELLDSVDVTLTRATVGTANSAWRIWDLHHISPEMFPPYWPTLTSVLGSRLASALNVYSSSSGSAQIYEYVALMTLVVKNFETRVNVATSNVTATVFGEGVIALGSPGYLILSVIAGIVVGINRNVLRMAGERGLPLRSALAATYFMTSVVSWLNAGGVTALFLVPFIVNYTLIYLLGYLLLSISHIPVTCGRQIAVTTDKWRLPSRVFTQSRQGSQGVSEMPSVRIRS